MESLDQNNLSSLNFRFVMKRAPQIEYRVQSVTLPGLSLGAALFPSPFVQIFEPGNLTYGELTVNFLVGEKMKDYFEIFNWMVSLGHPDSLSQYDSTATKSDCSVFILNSSMRPMFNVHFTDAFPINLSDLNFDSTNSDVQYMEASVTFKFTRFYYEPVT